MVLTLSVQLVDERRPHHALLSADLRLRWGIIVFTLALLTPSLASADSDWRFWPQFNGFFGLSDNTRLTLIGSDIFNDTESRATELGANLDLTLQPILRTRLREEDWERERFLWMRIGYTYIERNYGVSPRENRGTLEANGREPFDDGFSVVGRLRWEMRDIEENYSNRYRVRLGVETVSIVGGRRWVPYVDAETFYDARFNFWSRQLYRAGVDVSLNRKWRIEPYFGYQDEKVLEPHHLNIFGLTLKYTH